MPMGYERGLTLIELMIVVAILGIIAAVAWPAYEREMATQRRSEAIRALSLASNGLERCFADTADYSSCAISTKVTSSLKYYTLALAASAASYTITATPTGVQAGDECGSLTLDQLGQKGRSAASVPVSRCWSE